MVTPTKWDKTDDKGSFQGAPNLNVGKQEQQQEWLKKTKKSILQKRKYKKIYHCEENCFKIVAVSRF